MTWVEPLILVASLGVLLGMYQGHKGWGRTVLWMSVLVLLVVLVMYGPDIFYQLGCSMVAGGC